MRKRSQVAEGAEQLFVKYWEYSTEEDSYDQGVVGREQQAASGSNEGPFGSIDDLIAHFVSDIGAPEDKADWGIFGDDDQARIETDWMVDVDNYALHDGDPTLEAWKKGKASVWLARLTLYVKIITERTPSEDELVKMTGLSAR